MSDQDVLAGGGELGARMRAMDWSTTTLGAKATWPASLRSALSICVGSRFPIAIYWGPELALLYNDAWSPILGQKHPWALARPALEVWPEIWDTIGPMFQNVMATGEATYAEDSLLLMRRHGYTEECFFNFTFSPIRGEDGHVDGIFNAVIETTFRVLTVRRARALRDMGERLAVSASTDDVARLAVESLGCAPEDVAFSAIYVVEDRAARLVASSGLEVGGPAAPQTIALDAHDAAWPLADAAKSKHALVVESLRQRLGIDLPGGAWPEPASTAMLVPVFLPLADRPHAFLVLGVSPRRSVDDAYLQFAETAGSQLAASFGNAQRREDLVALDRQKTAFFSNVSHELRTPLALMLGPIEDMAAQPLAADEQERVELLHRNALRLLKLVNTLLEFSRIEAGRVEATFEPLDLASVTTDLASTFRSAIERAGLAFVVECPPLREALFVDREMWEKIVLNLLSNALKFTFEGSITIRLRDSDRGAELEVTDTGTGIEERELPRLFERFHRIEGARSRSHEGSGIGLALVQELVRLQGGTIEVRSRPGEGTTFRVGIPSGKAHVPFDRIRVPTTAPVRVTRAYAEEALRWIVPPTNAIEPTHVDREVERETRARILVADDNADMREYVARLLRERWEVETVADGVAALAAARRKRPDLVLSDVMMPGLDGFALLRAIRADVELREVPVVLLSARAGQESASEGLEAGADDYLIKPFNARDLLVRVAARLATSSARSRERRRLLSMLQHIPAIVNFLRGPELVFEFAHPKAIEAFGGRALVGKPLLEAIPEYRDQPEILSRLRRVFETGEPSVVHELEAKAVGVGQTRSTFWDSVYVPILDDAGHADGVMTFDLDVTERVEARRAIERANHEKDALLAQFRAVIDNLPELAWTARADGFIDFYNHRWFEYTGTTMEHAEGWGWKTVHDPALIDSVIARWNHSLSSGEPFEMEFPLRRRDGAFRWFLTRAFPLRDELDRVVRWVGMSTDVHALREAHEARRELLRELEQSSRAKDEFVATMSHELRTPLNAMLGWAKILQADHGDEARLVHGLTVIRRNAEAQARLVEDILDVSRIITGKLQLRPTTTAVALVIEAAIDVVTPAADAKGVSLALDLDPALGMTISDPDRLQQIVWNLLSNAVRFTPAGGRVSIDAHRSGAMIAIRVQDTGCGIAGEHLPHVFERFRQVDSSAARGYGGLGLGLAIVRHLVEAHGGSVSAESAGVGLGATFTVRLPIHASTAQVTAAAPPSTETHTSDKAESRSIENVRVLVVEDDADSLELVRYALEGAGATVTAATSAREALSEEGPFDIIVSDIGMPGVDGYAFIRAVRSRDVGAGTPAIALTAYARPQDETHALRSGYQAHIPKPLDASKLIEAVKRWAG